VFKFRQWATQTRPEYLLKPHTIKTIKINNLIVPYWNHPEEKPSQVLLDALISAWQRGAEVVGLCPGPYVLAYSGLPDRHLSATHREYDTDSIERFPTVHLDSNSLYTSDG
jgi:transcriptional regulator GlxA family with amidase domain